jgi:hypothetical protein
MSVRFSVEEILSAGTWIGTHGRVSRERGLPRASNRKYLIERLTWSSFVKVHKLMLKQSQFALLSSRNKSFLQPYFTISLKVLRLFLRIPGTIEILLYTGLDTLYVLLPMSLFSSEESHITNNVLCTPSLHLGTLAQSLHMVHAFLALTLCSSFGMEVRSLSGFF